MPCYSPLKGFRSLDGVERGGKPRITFNPIKAINSTNPVHLPCGQCVGCRLDKVEQWGLRCMHESEMHERSAFLTLTYNDEHLPADYSVKKPVWQAFMKRLRKRLPQKLRFFACGEYGDEGSRPHYHCLLYGEDFRSDRKLLKVTDHGPLYESETLTEIWGLGHVWIGGVSIKSARYCAQYIVQKKGGDLAPRHYNRLHPKGYIVTVQPEFALQSRRPGIGFSWFEKYKSDAFPSDFLVVDGREVAVPAYYTRKLSEEEAKPIKRSRKARQVKTKDNSTPERLRVRETIRQAKLDRYKRTL